MTRKRKQTENMQQAEISVPIFSHHADATYNRQYLSSSAGYGSLKKAKASSNYDGNEFNGYDSSKRRKKASRNDRLENNDFKSEFERKYGYEKRQMHRTNDRKDEKREGEHEIEETNESMKTFPNELVSYLQKCTSSIEEDPDEMGETIREKCLEECSGMEMELCFYESSSRLIEKIFKGSRKGACRWIETFLKLKKTRQFEALCTGCACRCLETLIFALSTSLDVQMIEQLTDLIVDGWNDLVVDTNASRFIRSLIRVILELPKLAYNSSKSIGGQLDLFPKEWSNKEEQKRKKAKESLRNLQMKRNFEKIINLALDYNSMHDFMDMEAVSLLMQEIIEYDYFLKTAKINEFLTRSLEYPMSVLKQWKGRQSSRVWQVIVKRVNEDGRQSLYHSILNGKLLELALDNCANFVAQDFIASADSEELAADIFDELLDSLIDIFEHKKWSVIKGLVQAAARHECHQSALLHRLRALFNSSKKSTKHAFLPNIFTLNAADVVQDANGRVNFDISKGNLHGSLLLQDLLALKHNKTVVYSMLLLSKKTILEFAHDQKGSYVLQAFIKSPFISDEDKFPPAAFLKKKWWELIDDNIASHVFDAMWDNGLFTIDEKQQIMMTLCDAQKQKKSSLRRIILRRLNAHGFVENRNKWLQTEMRRMSNAKKATR